ncbi:MAG: hypothetical protein Q7J35_07435, partial [Candidatus Methanoperedens sp.]|nr:hypothetical protein [Candidatus Methanoperedens sp.]
PIQLLTFVLGSSFPFDLILRNTRSSPLANSTSLDLYHGSFVRDVNALYFNGAKIMPVPEIELKSLDKKMCLLLSESSLKKEWLRPEEDIAWRKL